ncbi:MAG TPA: hypothetical protein VGB55_05000 [Tepidisphaeraceae bacterium]|jgi:O-acetyl-ADP-ribose deacetylase (regulator of RNase III)
MKIVQGDLIKLALDGAFDIIVHGCNCFNAMHAGVARQVAHSFPEAQEADNATKKGDKAKLGTITVAVIPRAEKSVAVVNAYTQYDYGCGGVYVDYDAVRKVMKEIKFRFAGERIGYPKIGAGLAGGNWEKIAKIIDEELQGEDHTLVEYAPR